MRKKQPMANEHSVKNDDYSSHGYTLYDYITLILYNFQLKGFQAKSRLFGQDP